MEPYGYVWIGMEVKQGRRCGCCSIRYSKLRPLAHTGKSTHSHTGARTHRDVHTRIQARARIHTNTHRYTVAHTVGHTHTPAHCQIYT